MRVEIIDILQQPEWETVHPVRAIVVDGKCRVQDQLDELRIYHLEDFKKILKVVKMVTGTDRVRNTNHVKRGKRHPEIFEMRAHKGSARLYFFYAPRGREIVICTNSYWKAKSSKEEENMAFEKAEELRQLYLKSRPL